MSFVSGFRCCSWCSARWLIKDLKECLSGKHRLCPGCTKKGFSVCSCTTDQPCVAEGGGK